MTMPFIAINDAERAGRYAEKHLNSNTFRISNRVGWLEAAHYQFPFELAGVTEGTEVERILKAIATQTFDPLETFDPTQVPETVEINGIKLMNPYFHFIRAKGWSTEGIFSPAGQLAQLANTHLMQRHLIDPQDWINSARRKFPFETSAVPDGEVETNLCAIANGSFDPEIHLDMSRLRPQVNFGMSMVENPYVAMVRQHK